MSEFDWDDEDEQLELGHGHASSEPDEGWPPRPRYPLGFCREPEPLDIEIVTPYSARGDRDGDSDPGCRPDERPSCTPSLGVTRCPSGPSDGRAPQGRDAAGHHEGCNTPSPEGRTP